MWILEKSHPFPLASKKLDPLIFPAISVSFIFLAMIVKNSGKSMAATISIYFMDHILQFGFCWVLIQWPYDSDKDFYCDGAFIYLFIFCKISKRLPWIQQSVLQSVGQPQWEGRKEEQKNLGGCTKTRAVVHPLPCPLHLHPTGSKAIHQESTSPNVQDTLLFFLNM